LLGICFFSTQNFSYVKVDKKTQQLFFKNKQYIESRIYEHVSSNNWQSYNATPINKNTY